MTYLQKIKRRGYKVKVCWQELDKGKVRSVCGLTDFETKTVFLNIFQDIADTLIHEFLHVRYPSFSEKQVRAITKKIRRRMPKDKLIRNAMAVLRLWKKQGGKL